MKKPVYSVFDKVSLVYAPIWPSSNDQTAIREFKSMRFGPGVPDTDLALYCIGMFDDAEGQLVGTPLRFVVNGGVDE